MENSSHFHATKMRPLVQMIARLVKNNPMLADEPKLLMATLNYNIPGFDDPSKCINCGASMAEYMYNFTILDALLIFGMARQVAKNLEQNQNFTLANQVHLPSLKGVSHTVKIRQGYTSKLGLIAKLKGKNGRQIRGMWVITKRGWATLRGEPVPKAVRVFRGQILDRPDETVTITQVFRAYGNSVDDALRKGKEVKNDNRKDMEGYDPGEWVQVAGLHQGELL